MNKNLLFIFLLFISTSAFSQLDGNYNYSIGIKAFNIGQLPKILNQSNTDDYTQTWFNGGIIRFNDNQMSFRLSGHYLFKRDLKFSNQCDNCESANGNLTDYAIKIGFEKNFNYSIIQPYFAVDLGFRANSFHGEITSTNTLNTNATYSAITNKNGATLSPVLGFKINVLKQLSIFAESSIDFYYAYERQETILRDAANTRTFAKYNKLESLLNPVSIGIQIHLIGKN
ncbi:hypothetical protein [Pedobacter sp. ASV28]|uniref:hypothetical protein n=1 Tax=Pedobacter sp. ASV28 TaxID=2795123 RepID=UPI0018ED2679|nr:hypothetical protein [Pedobacter sp. ASV28]